MAVRVGNPVPDEIREQLGRNEAPLVYELVTPPKDPGELEDGSWAERFAAAIRTGDQHELLLTKQRLAVVASLRGKQPHIALSVPRHQIAGVTAAGAGLERGRLRFDFRDGSTTHGVMGLLLPRPAQRFLAAHEASDPRRPGAWRRT